MFKHKSSPSQISLLIAKSIYREYENDPISVPQTCCAHWNDTNNSHEHYQKLTCVQWHKCVGTYCIRKKNIQMEPNMVTHIVDFGFHWTSKPPGASILLYCIIVQFAPNFLVKEMILV